MAAAIAIECVAIALAEPEGAAHCASARSLARGWPLSRLLHRASWQAEKLFKARGWLLTMVWVTEAKDGRRQMFETSCEAERAEISDAQALAALCAELRADFAAEGVVRYAVAFPASATTLLWPFALHLDIERREHDSLCSASRR